MDIRRGRLQGWETPLLLLGAVVLSYGLWIPFMGLFGNDVPYLWYYHLLGPSGPGFFASIDRPVSAIFYAVTTFLLGEAVWPYHVLLLILRWVSAVLLWWVLGLVWPERKREAALAAFLFAVYPGFRQNPIALEFILHFYVLDLFLLSLGTMILSFCRPRQYALFALLTAAATGGLFSLEYFIGLEILRPIFLWVVTRRAGLKGTAQWKRILLAWLPAVVVVLAFLYWRIFIFSFPTYRPVVLQTLLYHPAAGIRALASLILHDLWIAFAGAWLQTRQLPNAGVRSLLIYLGLLFAGASLVALLWWRTRKQGLETTGRNHWGETMFAIGLVAMFFGGSIFWLTGIPITLDFPWDRSTLALMPGACLAMSGLIVMVVTPRYRPVVFCGLVALAIGMHFVNMREYRAEWNKLQDFYWQLTWRAPQLEPGTLGIFDVIPLNRYSDNDMTAMLNWTYAPDQHSLQIPYKFFDLTLRLDENRMAQSAGLPGLEKDLPVEIDHRGTSFKSTTSSALVLTYNPPACLQVLGPDDALMPDLTDHLKKVLPISNLGQIKDTGVTARPPVQLGPEPPHKWCYYFQKAELARQQHDWTKIAALGDAIFATNPTPGAPSELLPFIEGYAHAGNLDRAQHLSLEIVNQPNIRPVLCALWKRLSTNGAAVPMELKCQP